MLMKETEDDTNRWSDISCPFCLCEKNDSSKEANRMQIQDTDQKNKINVSK